MIIGKWDTDIYYHANFVKAQSCDFYEKMSYTPLLRKYRSCGNLQVDVIGSWMIQQRLLYKVLEKVYVHYVPTDFYSFSRYSR